MFFDKRQFISFDILDLTKYANEVLHRSYVLTIFDKDLDKLIKLLSDILIDVRCLLKIKMN